MIPTHKQFIEAIHAKKKVSVRFDSKADNGVVDRVCAPMDYGPGAEFADGLNRYWLWDYASNTAPRTLSLVPQQIVDLQMLGELFGIEGAASEVAAGNLKGGNLAAAVICFQNKFLGIGILIHVNFFKRNAAFLQESLSAPAIGGLGRTSADDLSWAAGSRGSAKNGTTMLLLA